MTCRSTHIIEMEHIGSSPELKVRVQADFAGLGNTYRYFINKSDRWDKIYSLNLAPKDFEINTGDPEQFNDFLFWAFSESNEENRSIILWGHGSGWRPSGKGRAPIKTIRTMFYPVELFRQLGMDLESGKDFGVDFNDGYSSLDILQIDNQLNSFRSNGPKFDFIGFDACLMSSIEVSYQLLSHSDYLLVSASEEPSDGWPYDRVLEILSSKDPSLKEKMEKIVNAYVESYSLNRGNQVADKPITFSAIDITKMPLLANNISSFAKLATKLLEENSDKYYSIFGKAKSKAKNFRLNSYIDISSFMWKIQEKLNPIQQSDDEKLNVEINNILNVIEKSVYKKSIDDYPNHELDPHGGLTIYFPPEAYNRDHPLRKVYEMLKFYKDVPDWWNFVLKFYE
jgi:hypothetical protein